MGSSRIRSSPKPVISYMISIVNIWSAARRPTKHKAPTVISRTHSLPTHGPNHLLHVLPITLRRLLVMCEAQKNPHHQRIGQILSSLPPQPRPKQTIKSKEMLTNHFTSQVNQLLLLVKARRWLPNQLWRVSKLNMYYRTERSPKPALPRSLLSLFLFYHPVIR